MTHKEPVPLEITAFSKKGLGRAFHNGTPVDILNAVPGDHIETQLGRKRRGSYTPHSTQWIAYSPLRIHPSCPHFEQCGGCKWQQISYNQQLIEKQAVVERLFGPVEPIIGCSSPWAYRNKMEFTFSSDRAGHRYLGLCQPFGKGRVLNLHECHIAPGWMAEALQKVRQWWDRWNLAAYHPPSNTGLLRTLTLREGVRTGERLAMLTTSDESISREALEELVLLFGRQTSLVHRVQRLRKGEPTQFVETCLSGSGSMMEQLVTAEGRCLSFRVSATAFFQPNTLQAERIYQEALKLAEVGPEMTLLDLYCGTGTLGLFAATLAARVIGIELNADAVRDAQANAKLNGIENIEFFACDVGEWLESWQEQPDLAIVDPPRAGLGTVAVQHLLRLRPKKIAYISCQPTTQKEDLLLLQEGGYRLDKVQPVDQFPHTIHIENIAILSDPE